jgi:hypothetical protein
MLAPSRPLTDFIPGRSHSSRFIAILHGSSEVGTYDSLSLSSRAQVFPFGEPGGHRDRRKVGAFFGFLGLRSRSGLHSAGYPPRVLHLGIPIEITTSFLFCPSYSSNVL